MTEIIDRAASLPSLPHTSARITALIASGVASSQEFEEIARADEALSAAILRWANSVVFGRPGRVFTLRESITRLGTANIGRILVQQQASGVFAGAGAAYGMPRGAMWRGAYGGALAAESLARAGGAESPETCFVCALLRDIGKVVLDAHYGAAYLDLVSRHATPGRTFVDAERAALGFDHAELGGELARRWGLPERVAAVIARHHAPPADPPARDLLADIVHAADIVALWAGLGVGFDGMQYRLADHVRTGLRLDRARVEGLIVDLWAGLRQVEALTSPADQRRAAS